LLAFRRGDHDAGIYQSVFKLILLMLVLPDVLTNALTPTLSRLNVESIARWKRVGCLMNKILAFIGIPISMILFVYAKQIVDLLYGLERYHEAVPVLQILSLMLFVRFTFETYSLVLTTSGRQRIRMYVVILVTALNFILNYILIPMYGAIGAAVVSLICNTIVGLVYCLVSASLFVEWHVNSKSSMVYLASAATGLVFWTFRGMSMFVGIPLLLFIFWLIAYYYFFSYDEKKLIFSAEFGFSILK
jgi:O-antigen/teichoic acid export membrane protein